MHNIHGVGIFIDSLETIYGILCSLHRPKFSQQQMDYITATRETSLGGYETNVMARETTPNKAHPHQPASPLNFQ